MDRKDEIDKLIKWIKQTSTGQNINAFITGERGIGKSSLALFVKYLLENDNSLLPKDIKFLTAYCFLGPAKTIPEVCKLMVEKLITSIRDESLWGKIKSSLGKYIDHIGLDLFGIGVKVGFKKDLEDLPSDFYSIVKYIWNMMKEKYKGVMLVLDDINNATKIEGFSMFLKSFV
ncbi:MAG TPA: ATP-binding protein, partial [bacterium (Candidatus Stahlbacteria)]|nr:ATP-binding protein [Candidatus Stahlbacteria bacterium]